MAHPIRNSAKAVIVRDGALLLIRKEGDTGPYYIFPGGGQEKYEDLRAALRRECEEEIGCRVFVNDLLWIREYIGRNHEFAAADAATHQVEFYFSCRMEDGANPGIGPKPDAGQVAVEWINLDRLPNTNVYPLSLRGEFVAPSRRYFGAVN